MITRKGKTCDKCRGSGEMKVESPYGHYVPLTCDKCNGKGLIIEGKDK